MNDNTDLVETAPVENSSVSAQPSVSPLSTGAKVGIAIGVVVVVGLVVGLVLYFAVFHKSTGNKGNDKFGRITIKDTTSNVAGTSFAPGDTLQLQYTASNVGFPGRCVWTLSTDGGKTFPISISDSTFGNTVQYQIPENTFTQTAVFKVADHANTADFVLSDTCTMDPVMQLTSGPGVNRGTDIIHTGVDVVCKLTIDTSLNGLTNSGWVVELTPDPAFTTGIITATIVSGALGTDTATVTWNTSVETKDVYYRVRTSGLKTAGYPYELAAVAPNHITVTDSLSCKGVTPPADPSQFYICSFVVTDSSGVSGTLSPAETVNLVFSFVNTFPGQNAFSFTYTIDGGASVTWTATFVAVSNGKAVFTAQVPNQLTSAFVATVSGSSSQDSTPPYAIEPTFTILGLSSSSQVLVYPQYVPIYQTTQVQMNPASTQPPVGRWQVGYADDVEGTNVKLVAIQSVSYTAQGLATIVWRLTWENSGLPQPAAIDPYAKPDAVATTRALVFSMQPDENQPLKIRQYVPGVVYNVGNYQPAFNAIQTTVQGDDTPPGSTLVYSSAKGGILTFVPVSATSWAAIPIPVEGLLVGFAISDLSRTVYFGALRRIVDDFTIFDTPTKQSSPSGAEIAQITRISSGGPNNLIVNIVMPDQNAGGQNVPLGQSAVGTDELRNSLSYTPGESPYSYNFNWPGQPIP